MRKYFQTGIVDRLDVQIMNDEMLIRSDQTSQYTLEELLLSCSPESVKISIEDIKWLQNFSFGKEL